jgi:seryl-tRNA(Sec) selenium transferase
MFTLTTVAAPFLAGALWVKVERRGWKYDTDLELVVKNEAAMHLTLWRQHERVRLENLCHARECIIPVFAVGVDDDADDTALFCASTQVAVEPLQISGHDSP